MMTSFVCERLPGCNAESLDAYLRGLGFFLLAGRVDASVRGWWDDRGILNLASPGVDAIAHRIAQDVLAGGHLITPVRTPWRGSAGRNQRFVDLRNSAEEWELDWFDACALPRVAEPEERTAGRAERSDRENNPILGQGGGFGRSEVAAAYQDAVCKLRRSRLAAAALGDALLSLLRGEALDGAVARSLSVKRDVLGAYQSGRATGPGLSSKDVEPTHQDSRTNAWDLILVIQGLRAFRGVPTRRPEPTARVQGSFPLVTRARPIGTAPVGALELREDSPDTYELLAPLWSEPCSPRVVRHLLGTARLRTGRGIARDTLDAVLVQAARAAQGLGFDRLVRFAFVPGSDPRYRYAVRRGGVQARGLRAARSALEEIVPFLRHLDSTVDEAPPALAVARRRLEDALAVLGVQRLRMPTDRTFQARQIQDLLIALALAEPAAARASRQDFDAPSLSPTWLQMADDGSPEYRLARALVAGLTAGSVSLLRSTILPQRDDRGRWVLDPQASPPDLERVSDPIAKLVLVALLAIRRRERSGSVTRLGTARLEDVALLLSGAIGGDGERRLLLLAAALAGVWMGESPRSYRDAAPESLGVGAEVARLLLAAQPADDEDPDKLAWLERAERVASFLVSGRYNEARIVADRELRRRGLELLPLPPLGSAVPSAPSRLALAALLPLNSGQRTALARVVSVTLAPASKGGSR